MLTQKDFLSMLDDLQTHTAKTVSVIEGLITGTGDKELCLKFVALKQTKLVHLETMQALSALVKEHVRGGAAEPVVVTKA